MNATGVNLKAGFDSLQAQYVSYFEKFTHDHPIVFTLPTVIQLKELGLLLYRAIDSYCSNFSSYSHILPRMENEARILEICRQYPYRVGSFRADFIVDQNKKLRIIEFNVGQPLNGFFTTGFFNAIAQKQALAIGIAGMIDIYSPLFPYLEKYLCGKEKICVVHGDEYPGELKFYPGLFKNAGIDCITIHINTLDENLHLLANSRVITELLPEEILSISDKGVHALCENQSHNGIIPVLFSGSKRFFSLLRHPEFLQQNFTSAEAEIIQKFIVQTYLAEKSPEIWADALTNKNKYILKHHFMGRGEEVHPGFLTPADQWEKLITSEFSKNYVLQEFITQKQFAGSISGKERLDFITGTLLFINQEFFGPGFIRTHTTPVTKGTGDFKKIAPLISDSENRIPGIQYL